MKLSLILQTDKFLILLMHNQNNFSRSVLIY